MQELRGIMPPLATPFDNKEELNEAAVKAEVNYMIEQAGVHGVVVGGSTGEGHTLATDELRRLVGTACDAAAGRVPVIAGLIVDSTRQAVERVRALADLSVVALQVTPVHYLFKPNDEMMQRHFAAIADAAGTPVMIYNVVPWSYCSPALLTKIITEVDGVIGVKQSAGDLKLLADLMLLLDDRGIVFSAVDALLYPSYTLGAHGAIAAILTAAPKLCVDQWQAVQQGDHATALAIHQTLLRIWNAMPHDNLPANIKTAMRLQGRDGGIPRAPMQQSSPQQEAAIRSALDSAGLLT
ncbi:MAG TPA: dihydrodipicolinate synthase family protein [Caldilineaceae bacterium]|nr:dihydrodipicolinate synthase family protein [Caldilineaceae bacterium]HRW07310.1 dihydrodipicolinate synthase family protein [Caldilineaceae bacterium]